MDIYSGHINKLIEQLSRLPGVGAKSAQRLAFHIINMPKEDVQSIADAMVSAKENVHYCKECFTRSEEHTSELQSHHCTLFPYTTLFRSGISHYKHA